MPSGELAQRADARATASAEAASAAAAEAAEAAEEAEAEEAEEEAAEADGGVETSLASADADAGRSGPKASALVAVAR